MRIRGAGRYGNSSIGPDTSSAVHFQGDPTATVIRNTAGGHVIEITNLGSVPTSIQRDTEISDLVFEGPATDALGHTVGAGHGIYVHDVDTGGGPSGLTFHDLWIVSVGGKGVFVTQEFTSSFARIDVHNCGDHAFDLAGGNTTRLDSCYAHWVGAYSSGTPYYPAGYRIHGGSPTLISCNGLDSGRDWGVFGDTVAEDGATASAFVTMIGCNVEAFRRYGVRCKTGSSASLIGNKFDGYNFTSPNPIAISLNTPLPGMHVDDSNLFLLEAGAAWANGQAIHFTNTPPLIFGNPSGIWQGSPNGNAGWNDGTAALSGLPAIKVGPGNGVNIYPLSFVGPTREASAFARLYGAETGSIAWTPGIIAANSEVSIQVTVPFAQLGDPAVGSYDGAALPAGVHIAAEVTTSGSVRVTLYNLTASATSSLPAGKAWAMITKVQP